MVTSMPLVSKSGQSMASVEFSHLSVSDFRENSRAVEPRFSQENKVWYAALISDIFVQI